MPDRYSPSDIRKTADHLDAFVSGPMGRSADMLRAYADTEEALGKLSKFVEEVGCDDRRDRPYQYVGAEMRNLGLWRDPQPREANDA